MKKIVIVHKLKDLCIAFAKNVQRDQIVERVRKTIINAKVNLVIHIINAMYLKADDGGAVLEEYAVIIVFAVTQKHLARNVQALDALMMKNANQRCVHR